MGRFITSYFNVLKSRFILLIFPITPILIHNFYLCLSGKFVYDLGLADIYTTTMSYILVSFTDMVVRYHQEKSIRSMTIEEYLKAITGWKFVASIILFVALIVLLVVFGHVSLFEYSNSSNMLLDTSQGVISILLLLFSIYLLDTYDESKINEKVEEISRAKKIKVKEY